MELQLIKAKADDPHFVAAQKLMDACLATMTPPPSATEQQIVGQSIASGIDCMLILAFLKTGDTLAGLNAMSSALAVYAARAPDPGQVINTVLYNAEIRLQAIDAANAAPAGTG